MLKYDGHIFDGKPHCTCCVGDANKVVIDPTGTKPLRNRFKADARRRCNQLRVATRDMINKQDILGLKAGSSMQMLAPGVALIGTRQEMFQRWFNQALVSLVMGQDGTWMRGYIDTAYHNGVRFGNEQLEEANVIRNASHRMDANLALATMELKGIMEAASQQATRVANLGIATKTKPLDIVRGVWEVIEKTLFFRINALVNIIIVKSFNDGVLDIYEHANVQEVGLIPEAANAAAQSKAKDAATVQDAPRKGAGSRVSRKKTPSRSTIGRIRRQEAGVARALGARVNVRTAGDDDVCPICQDIADDGPYKLDTARGLIPAHPNCRCTFVPANDKRFKRDAVASALEPV